jgi:hypothetical protein
LPQSPKRPSVTLRAPPRRGGCRDGPAANAIESINFQLRKLTKTRCHFPDDDAAVKHLYLGIRNITGRHIDGDGLVRERGERGTGTYG